MEKNSVLTLGEESHGGSDSEGTAQHMERWYRVNDGWSKRLTGVAGGASDGGKGREMGRWKG